MKSFIIIKVENNNLTEILHYKNNILLKPNSIYHYHLLQNVEDDGYLIQDKLVEDKIIYKLLDKNNYSYLLIGCDNILADIEFVLIKIEKLFNIINYDLISFEKFNEIYERKQFKRYIKLKTITL